LASSEGHHDIVNVLAQYQAPVKPSTAQKETIEVTILPPADQNFTAADKLNNQNNANNNNNASSQPRNKIDFGFPEKCPIERHLLQSFQVKNIQKKALLAATRTSYSIVLTNFNYNLQHYTLQLQRDRFFLSPVCKLMLNVNS